MNNTLMSVSCINRETGVINFNFVSESHGDLLGLSTRAIKPGAGTADKRSENDRLYNNFTVNSSNLTSGSLLMFTESGTGNDLRDTAVHEGLHSIRIRHRTEAGVGGHDGIRCQNFVPYLIPAVATYGGNRNLTTCAKKNIMWFDTNISDTDIDLLQAKELRR